LDDPFVLRVFVSEDGSGGNPLGVFLDGARVARERRQRVAAELGFSETVFVDDPATGAVQIFTPAIELAFAGHPLVGTAWLLARERGPVASLHPPAGEVEVRHEGELTFVAGRPAWGPQFELRQLSSPAEVDALDGPPDDGDLVDAWAWQDEAAGVVRARVFGRELGVEEDEATGAAAVMLAAAVGRPIEIRQGHGSLIHARPLDDGRVEIGGRVRLTED
jgi:predicted PhzF superfamily epimerase YddE/YHI9